MKQMLTTVTAVVLLFGTRCVVLAGGIPWFVLGRSLE